MKRYISILLLFVTILYSCDNKPKLASDSWLKVSVNSMEFTPEQGSQILEIASNSYWLISSESHWCSFSTPYGSETSSVEIYVEENDTYEERVCTINIESSALPRQVEIKQSARGVISIDTKVFALNNEQNTINVQLSSNLDIDVLISTETPWIRQIQTKGLTETHCVFEISRLENSDKYRDGQIIFKSKLQSDTVHITQYPDSSPLLIDTGKGSVRSQISESDIINVKFLALIGTNICDDDFTVIREGMPNLELLDLRHSKIEQIPDYAFVGNVGIKVVLFSDLLYRIGAKAFYQAQSLKEITLPNSITQYGEAAFAECQSLEKVILETDFANWGKELFKNCPKLSSVSLSATQTSIGEKMFRECNSLERIDITDEITYIGSGAFMGCKLLSSVNFGINSKIRTLNTGMIGYDYAYSGVFAGCDNLKQIELPNSLEEIGWMAFMSSGITEIRIPNLVKKLGLYIFAGCSDLKSIILPEAMEEIESSAFRGCTNLETVICLRKTPPTLKEDTFASAGPNVVLKIPKGSLNAYKSEPEWVKYFKAIEELD